MKCEECGEQIDPRDYYLVADAASGKWQVEDSKCDTHGYHIDIEDFEDDPVDWLAHMSTKEWFNAQDFCEALRRLRDSGYRRHIVAPTEKPVDPDAKSG